MQYSEFQQDRIKRFFLAVSVLAANPELRMNSQQATRLLVTTMDQTATPRESLPQVAVSEAQSDFFAFIAQYGAKDRACTKLFGLWIMVAFAIGAYSFYQGGLVFGVLVLVGALIGAFLLNLIIMKLYVIRDFSPTRYGLTPTEVNFALRVVADPQWQRSDAEA